MWYCEALRDTLHHNGGRLQYFPDGLFIGDYRIYSVASEQYVRTRGKWSVDHGVFTETADYVAGTDESIPKLARQVVAIKPPKDIKRTLRSTEIIHRTAFTDVNCISVKHNSPIRTNACYNL